jgi:hypothetical protein
MQADRQRQLTARLALRMVPAALNYDKASCLDLFDRVVKLMAAYVESEKGKKLTDRPDLLMTRAVGEIAAVIAGRLFEWPGEPSLREAVVAFLAMTADDDPRTHELEGSKSHAKIG